MTMKRLCAIALLLAWSLCALAAERSATIVYINGAKYYIHTVQPGETIYSLSKTYQVREQLILDSNPALAGVLKAAEKVKIPFVEDLPEQKSDRKLRKTFDFHFVSKGETIYAISRQYEIPIQTIVEDNAGLDPVHLRLGERILIRKKQIGSEDEAGTQAQWEEYRQTLSSVADAGFSYHIVRPGETFYSLARRFGIPEAELSRLNGGLKAAELKAGAMLKVPKAAALPPTIEADSVDTLLSAASESYIDDRVEEIEFRALRTSAPLNVALLLPLAVNGDANSNYLEFYQGFLLGLDSIRNRYGYSVNLSLYNTDRDSVKIRRIVESDPFAGVNLIVGPVYEEGLYPVIRFAEQHHVPVVSPLANITRMNSDVLFQLAPDPQRKYEKVADLVRGDKQVTLIYSESTDKDFEQEILTLLGDFPYARHTYKYVHPTSSGPENSPSDLTPLLENDADNVFVILSDNEVEVDRILAAIASADTNLTSRGHTPPRFVVLGNAHWNRYNNLDRTMFFKDRVIFLSTYHAKRDSQNIVDFDRNYIRAFGALPTLYSYRGFDSAMIFCPGMYGDIEYDMEGRRYTPLQTSYLFGQGEGRHNHVNGNWTRVNYNKDFTVTIE